MKISWKFTLRFYRNVANRPAAVPRWETGKQSRYAELFLVSSLTFLENFTKISSFVFSFIILLTNTEPANRKIASQDSRRWPQHPENVPYCSLSYVRPSLKNSLKSIQPVSCDVVNIHVLLWKSQKNIPVFKGWNGTSVFKGLNGTSWKCSRLLFIPRPTSLIDEIGQSFFHNVANGQTNRQTNKRTMLNT